jgi:spore coat polysaccharide biosynthesis protein SpsF (cytidylyltransferase family)
MRVLEILKALMSSSRLPGKVLMGVEGLPMTARQIDRVSRSTLIDDIVVATS